MDRSSRRGLVHPLAGLIIAVSLPLFGPLATTAKGKKGEKRPNRLTCPPSTDPCPGEADNTACGIGKRRCGGACVDVVGSSTNCGRCEFAFKGRAFQNALIGAIADRRGYCDWTVDHAGWVKADLCPPLSMCAPIQGWSSFLRVAPRHRLPAPTPTQSSRVRWHRQLPPPQRSNAGTDRESSRLLAREPHATAARTVNIDVTRPASSTNVTTGAYLVTGSAAARGVVRASRGEADAGRLGGTDAAALAATPAGDPISQGRAAVGQGVAMLLVRFE